MPSQVKKQGPVSHLYDDRLATCGKEATERALVRSNCTREWTAVQFVRKGEAKLELFLPCSMYLVCLTFALECEFSVS